MQALLDAIYSAAIGSATMRTLLPAWTPPDGSTPYPAGAFHLDLAPGGAPLPILVLSVVPRADSQSKYGGGMAFEPISIRWTVYGNISSKTTVGNAETVMSVFDDLILSLATGTMTNNVRRGQPIPRLDPSRDNAGNDVWSASWVYDFTISH